MNIRRCFQCETVNPPEQSFCGNCGAALVLKDYIAAQVNKGIAELPRDREALIKADAVEVFEKAWGWAKLTAYANSGVSSGDSSWLAWLAGIQSFKGSGESTAAD